MLKITLTRSVIGRPKKHKIVVASLGLRKINQTVQLKDTLEVRGMINKVCHLLTVEDSAPTTKQTATKFQKPVESAKPVAPAKPAAPVEEAAPAKETALPKETVATIKNETPEEPQINAGENNTV